MLKATVLILPFRWLYFYRQRDVFHEPAKTNPATSMKWFSPWCRMAIRFTALSSRNRAGIK